MPTTFEQVFHVIEKHVGKPMVLHIGEGKRPKPGVYKITIFDWSRLDKPTRSGFIESQVMPLFSEHGKDWWKALCPFAMLDSENPIEDFDEQCGGILLLDLTKGTGADCPVHFFDPPDGMGTYVLKGSLGTLDLRSS